MGFVRSALRLFVLLHPKIWGCTRSSMDRIPDSGSDDMGSIPIGCTKKGMCFWGTFLFLFCQFCLFPFLLKTTEYWVLSNFMWLYIGKWKGTKGVVIPDPSLLVCCMVDFNLIVICKFVSVRGQFLKLVHEWRMPIYNSISRHPSWLDGFASIVQLKTFLRK